MTDEAMKAMARRIAQDTAPAVLECLFGGTSSDTVKRVVHDGLKAAALAAIIETRDRDAALVERMIPKPAGGMFSHTNSMRVVLTDAAAAIRSGQQFRKDV